MEIDLINGTYRYHGPDMFGIKRYIWEIHKRLPLVRLNVIECDNRPFGWGSHLDRLLNDYLHHPCQIRTQLRTQNVRLIVAQNFAYLLSRLDLSPCALVCHDLIRLTRPFDYPSCMNDFLLRLSYRNFKLAEKIITVSQYTCTLLLSHYPISPERIAVIPNGVDLQRFSPNPERREAFRKQLGLQDYCIILYVGSEEPRKNLTVLIKTLAILRRKIPNLHFVKIGHPQYQGGRERFLKTVEAHGLTDILTLIDHLPENSGGLPAAYNAADFYLFPSLDEGFGLTPLEAMASGTPVICSQAASLPEVVGQGGVLVPPSLPEAFADAVEQLLSDPIQRENLIAKGRQQAHTYQWEHSAKKMMHVYQELAAYKQEAT